MCRPANNVLWRYTTLVLSTSRLERGGPIDISLFFVSSSIGGRGFERQSEIGVCSLPSILTLKLIVLTTVFFFYFSHQISCISHPRNMANLRRRVDLNSPAWTDLIIQTMRPEWPYSEGEYIRNRLTNTLAAVAVGLDCKCALGHPNVLDLHHSCPGTH